MVQGKKSKVVAVSSTSTPRMTIKYTKNEAGEFVCPDCGVIKKRQNSMHYHMKKHMEELNYVCKACNKGFLQKQTLDLHLRSKHPELLKQEEEKELGRKFHCPFDDCEFKALTKGNCIIHCLRVHFQEEIREIMDVRMDTKTIVCMECDKEFHSSCSFYYHCKDCMIFDESDEKYEKLQEAF